MTSKNVVVDLFCGCGGLSTGLKQAGYDVKLGVDFDAKILETYARNHGENETLNFDLSNWKAAAAMIKEKVPDYNIIAGSPPCQQFSRCGSQVEGERAELTVSFAKIIDTLNPIGFIMENVCDIESSATFKAITELLMHGGYSLLVLKKDAAETGVPQRRKRLFLFGLAATRKNHAILKDIHENSKRKSDRVSVAQYFSKETLPIPKFLYFFPRNKFQAQVVSTDDVYPTMRSSNGVCLKKNPYTEGYVRRPNDAAELKFAESLTIQQAAAISSFPKTYWFPEDRKQAGIQLGNCVPPRLGRFIAHLLFEHLHEIDEHPECTGEMICAANKQRNLKKVSHIAMFFKLLEEQGKTNVDAIEEINIEEQGQAKLHRSHGSFQTVNVCETPRTLSYTIGADETIDLCATRTIGFSLKYQWTFMIKERRCQKSRIDDMFVRVPGQEVPFRGKAMLLKNGLLP